jgi:hypothetical protein
MTDENDDQHTSAIVAHVSPSKFTAASKQSATIAERYRVLRLIMDTPPRSKERQQAVLDASKHHEVPVRTIYRWIAQCEKHGWDMDALGRKEPADAGKQRVWVSREFDRHYRAAGYDQVALQELADWLTRLIAGWWQSPVGRAGWKRVTRETLTSLARECRERGFDLPAPAFKVSRRRIEELRFHRVVDIMQNDAKRFDDAKPRIRRDNSKLAPMEQIVMDVKPVDNQLTRPDGSLACPKLIAFMDNGTHRTFGKMFLLPPNEGIRQEHVTQAFLEMVQDPDWGFPQTLYRDNGSEFAHFDLIRDALKMIAEEGARVIINAKPYSGASKQIESKFSVLDKHIFSLMGGYIGSDRMDKKVQRVGKDAKPYEGSLEDFEAEFKLRLRDFETWEIGSGPFMGRSPTQIYRDHVDAGWRPVSVNPLALDCAFAKQLGDRKVDRGAIRIGPDRFRHPELAAFCGRRVRVIKPFRRDAWPLADLPEIGWVALEPEMQHLPGEIAGAVEAGRMQTQHRKATRKLKAKAAKVDPLTNISTRVAALPTRAAPAPIIDLLMSQEAERFAGARIEAEAKRENSQSAEQRLIARQNKETEILEKYLANRK